jgi:elongation factor G
MGQEDNYCGVIDLVEGRSFTYDGDSGEYEEGGIPEEYRNEFEIRRLEMIEKVAEADEHLQDKFLMEEEITVSDLKAAIRESTIAYKMVPVLSGSALKNKCIHPLLDAIGDYLPSPLDVPAVEGTVPGSDK